ncbi:hypothetical protein [Defluviimonas salinarum]|uniref:hypothetical protein n=1 Tax=Defluviimonas salinarum TaxID=2992147 RepID=UPI00222FB290|nr:hypothetical protein [Defluviimonas salinarum]
MTVTSEFPGDTPEMVLAALLQEVATELASSAALAGSVQVALSRCRFSVPPDPETLTKLQGLDRISQSLDSVSRLMASLSACLPQDVMVATSALNADQRHNNLPQRITRSGRTESGESLSRPGDVAWL